MTWLRTQNNILVNLDTVKVIDVNSYYNDVYHVVAEIQVTRSEDHAIVRTIFTGDKWYCHQFIDFLYTEIAKSPRVIDVADYIAAFQSDDVDLDAMPATDEKAENFNPYGDEYTKD